MYLIPLNEAIYYNATQIDLSLVVLIAFAYHPTSANILYLFYGIMSSGRGGLTYSQFQFLVRDSNSGSFLQNTTIMQAYGCQVNCEMKATQNLLLIQSQAGIGIYPLNSSNYHITPIPIFTSPKSATNQITQIHRWGDINANNFFVVTSVVSCMFGQYDSSGSGLTTFQNYSMNLKIADILYVSMKSNMVYIVVNSSSVSFIFFDCLTCAFSNTISSLNQNNTFVVRTNISTPNQFRLYQGTLFNDSPLTNAMVYWGYRFLGISWKFIINSTHYQLVQIYNFNASYTVANKQYYFLFDSFYQVVFRSFKYVSTPTQNQTSTYFGYSFFSLSVDKAIISTDSALVAVTTFDSDWKIRQFQLVSNCSLYNVTINSANGLFCDCNLYNSNNRCTIIQDNSNSTSESKGSFPIVIVISVIAGVVVFVISIITIKKNYRRCTKGRRRTPYVYNQVELMSFQV